MTHCSSGSWDYFVGRALHQVQSTAASPIIHSGGIQDGKVQGCNAATDNKVRDAGVTTKARNKWAADVSVAQAEIMLKLRDIINNPCMVHSGL